MHGLVHIIVARAHDLGSAEIADESDNESGGGRLEILRPARPGSQARAEIANRLGKNNRRQATHHSQKRVCQQLSGPHQTDRRDAEKRLRAQKPAHHHHARNCRQHHGTENACAPAADHFFDHEQHSGNGRIKCSRQSRRGSDRSQQAQAFAGKFQAPPQRRRQAGADLQRGIFGSERLSRADGHGGRDEFSHRSAKRNVAVIDVKRGLGLVDPAAAHQRKHMDDQKSHDQADYRGGGNQPPGVWLQHRTEQPDPGPVNRQPETHHRQAGEQPDEHGQQQKETLFAGAAESEPCPPG